MLLKLQDSTKIELSYNNGKEITEIKNGIKFHLEKDEYGLQFIYGRLDKQRF